MSRHPNRRVMYGMWVYFKRQEMADAVVELLEEQRVPHESMCGCRMHGAEEPEHSPTEYCPAGMYVRVKLGWAQVFETITNAVKQAENEPVVFEETATES